MPEDPAPSKRVETALAYLDAGFRGDDDAVARLLGESYVWIDHCQGVIARTIEDLLRVAEGHRVLPHLRPGSRVRYVSVCHSCNSGFASTIFGFFNSRSLKLSITAAMAKMPPRRSYRVGVMASSSSGSTSCP
jgi:hypothetical protein